MKYVMVFLTGLIFFAAGYYVHHITFVPDAIEITQERIVYRPVERDYSAMEGNDCIAELKKYDTSEPRLNIDAWPVNGTVHIRSDAGLAGRTWSREATVTVKSNGAWKYGVGVAVGAGVAAGLVYLIK